MCAPLAFIARYVKNYFPGRAGKMRFPVPPRNRREIVSRMLFCFADSQCPAFYTVHRIYAAAGARCFPTESSWIVNTPDTVCPSHPECFRSGFETGIMPANTISDHATNIQRVIYLRSYFRGFVCKVQNLNSLRLHYAAYLGALCFLFSNPTRITGSSRKYPSRQINNMAEQPEIKSPVIDGKHDSPVLTETGRGYTSCRDYGKSLGESWTAYKLYGGGLSLGGRGGAISSEREKCAIIADPFSPRTI